MPPKILVVEDDHALRDVLLRGLRDEGFDGVPAADGATALRLAGDQVAAAGRPRAPRAPGSVPVSSPAPCAAGSPWSLSPPPPS